ncbi:hypothetical protein [Corynebacterium uterequi]|uniref:Uncharacterized protein n=1 Tax=Corynebacterium uterequi TaxID=1072256 RepID=A0A0G3HE46_9CORY|nr:hypothetical protein [Corynebacterium uterequi]AKK11589.1 hypothetical protein CUTER_08020 [Corynebacterium uterequi]
MNVKHSLLDHAAIIIAAFSSLALSFWTYILVSLGAVRGTKAVIQVQSTPPGQVDPEALLLELHSLATKHKGMVAVEDYTQPHPTIFASGPRAENWVTHGYGSLPLENDYHVAPLVDYPGADLRLSFFVGGTDQYIHDVTQLFESHGYQTGTLNTHYLLFLLQNAQLTGLTFAIIFLVAALSAAAVVLRSKEIAILRIHGYSPGRVIRRDLKDYLAKSLIAALSVLAAVVIVLALMSSLDAISHLLPWLLAFLAATYLAFFATRLLSIVILGTTSATAAAKGRLPGKAILGFTYAIKAIVAILLVGFVASGHNQFVEWQEQHQDRQAWDAAYGYEIARVSGAREIDETQPAEQRFAHLVDDLARQDKALLVDYSHAGIYTELPAGIGVMSIDPAGARESVTGPALSTLLNVDTSAGPVIVVPESIFDPAFDYASVLLPDTSSPTVITTKAGNDVFTWDTGVAGWAGDTVVKDPIFILYESPLDYGVRNLIAAVSQRRIVFEQGSLREAIGSDKELYTFIYQVLPVREVWAQSLAEIKSRTFTSIAGAILIIVFMGFVCFAASFIGRRIFAQPMTVYFLHGQSRLGAIYPIYLLELTGILGVAIGLYNHGSEKRRLIAQGVDWSTFDPAIAGGLVTRPGTIIVCVSFVLISTALTLALLHFGDPKKGKLGHDHAA